MCKNQVSKAREARKELWEDTAFTTFPTPVDLSSTEADAEVCALAAEEALVEALEHQLEDADAEMDVRVFEQEMDMLDVFQGLELANLPRHKASALPLIVTPSLYPGSR